jgi:hypothetical protein
MVVGLGLTAAAAAAAAAAQEPAAADADAAAGQPLDLPGVLQLVDFEASAFSYGLDGTLLWLSGPEGILRVEIRQAEPGDRPADPLRSLLAQAGTGWTAILGGAGGTDMVNAWGQAWRRPPAGLARLAQLVSEQLVAGPDLPVADARRWRARSGAPEIVRHQVPALQERSVERLPAGFRTGLVARGAGRSAAEELIELTWLRRSGPREARLQVRATGRAGRLNISRPTAHRIVYAMPEAFVPLWPLAELISPAPEGD